MGEIIEECETGWRWQVTADGGRTMGGTKPTREAAEAALAEAKASLAAKPESPQKPQHEPEVLSRQRRRAAERAARKLR